VQVAKESQHKPLARHGLPDGTLAQMLLVQLCAQQSPSRVQVEYDPPQHVPSRQPESLTQTFGLGAGEQAPPFGTRQRSLSHTKPGQQSWFE